MINPAAGNEGTQASFWLIVNAALLLPVVAGLSEITRIKYPVPASVAAGIVILMVPALAVEVKVPILVGLAKLPVASDSWAVYTFPALNVPVEVKSTVPASVVEVLHSTLKGGVDTVVVVIVVGGAPHPVPNNRKLSRLISSLPEFN